MLHIVVYWCLATAPFDAYNPHEVSAARKFWLANPATCGVSPAEPVFGPKSVQDCRGWAFVHWQPQWLAKSVNSTRYFMDADCFQEVTEPLDLEAMKRKVTP